VSYHSHLRQSVLTSACIALAFGAGLLALANPANASSQVYAKGHTTSYTLRKISNLVGYGLTLNGDAYGYNLATTLAEVVTPAGKVTTLTTPKGDQSAAEAGYGDYYAGSIFTNGTAVRWKLSGTSVSVQTLASVDDNGTIAEGVDAAGAVVGQSDAKAVLWKAGSTAVTLLPLPAGYTGGEATSISANGGIIGGGIATAAGAYRAATWLRNASGGYVVHLLTGTNTEVQAVNKAGIEAGGQLFGTGNAYEWLPQSGGVFKAVDLGGPAGDGCIATAIDNASTPAIIGDCSISKGFYAWIYSGDKTLTSLQPVIAKADPGVTATRAIGTDAAGQLLIEAQGAPFADYVLTPSSSTVQP
jgi:hypothetical protein